MAVITITTTGAGNVTVPANAYAVLVEEFGPGQNGLPGLEDDPENPGNTSRGGNGGAGGGYAKKQLAASAGQILYWQVGEAGQTSWFNLGTNSEAAASGG